eukprot:g8154.t1.1.5e17418a g8154  g8154.t1 contig27:313745-314504(-)
MISRTFLIAMILGSTNAFTAVNNHRGIVSRGVQKLNMIPDAEFEQKLKTEMKNASRATILECDDTECAQIQCEQDNRVSLTCGSFVECIVLEVVACIQVW